MGLRGLRGQQRWGGHPPARATATKASTAAATANTTAAAAAAATTSATTSTPAAAAASEQRLRLRSALLKSAEAQRSHLLPQLPHRSPQVVVGVLVLGALWE